MRPGCRSTYRGSAPRYTADHTELARQCAWQSYKLCFGTWDVLRHRDGSNNQ